MVLCRVTVLGVCFRMILCRLECRSVRLCVAGVLSFLVSRIWGHVLSPLICGSASVNIMSSGCCPSTTLRAAVFASSLWVTPVCDLTFPMCVLYPMLSLVRMISSASCRSSLWGWWLKLRGSMAYLRMVLMLKALSVKMARVWSHWLALRARVMAASSARFMVCLSGCDFTSICVVVCLFGFTMDAPRVGLPATREPSV